MVCLTAVNAEFAASRYLEDYGDFATVIASRNLESRWGEGLDARYDNYDRNLLRETVADGGRAMLFGRGQRVIGGNGHYLRRPERGKVSSAAAIFDGNGNLLECSWTDAFSFSYLTQAQWLNREDVARRYAIAFFDRDKLTEVGRQLLENGLQASDVRVMRFTGSFDGEKLLPHRIAFIDGTAIHQAVQAAGGGSYTVSGIVEDGQIPWTLLYDDPAATQEGTEVTLYSEGISLCYREKSPSFTYKETAYPNIEALVEQLGGELAEGYQNSIRYEGLDLLIPSVNYCYSVDGNRYHSSAYYGEAAYLGQAPQVHFYTVSVVHCSPWRTAFGELLPTYFWTLLLTLALVLAVWTLIRRKLLQPVLMAGNAMRTGELREQFPISDTKAWKEIRLLEQGLAACGDTMKAQKHEITRLEAALAYAKSAEENRRRMVSGLAHELKTPLAVIHSYAEGLQARIAEDKRERYIQVILSEAERTDGMVLEMLDLSRLEAGKVKLARDRVALLPLARAIFRKLEMGARDKALEITFSGEETLTVTADEGRLTQVIENFATNAIKYTPVGGRILVCAEGLRSGGRFVMENESEPLSEEALENVWDTFYRAEEARSGGGTGLGLAIARQIVELHGGKCGVRNTPMGVEFSFWLPG